MNTNGKIALPTPAITVNKR